MAIRSLVVASVLSTLVVPGLGAQQQAPPSVATQGAVRPGSGVTHPRLLKSTEPVYPAAAGAAQITGSVDLEAVVGPDGKVLDARVVRSLNKELGFDDEALRAAKLWIFEPGRKDGTPVPVIVTIILSFAPNRLSAEEQRMWREAIADDTTGLVKPVLVNHVAPNYSSDALRQGIEGVVQAEIVVLANGTVGAARVTKSLRSDLDNAALRAVRSWLFLPGMIDGKAVPVRTTVTVSFTLG